MKISQEDFLSIGTETLERDGVLRFRARGESMRPFIRHNDILIVISEKSARLNRGDVILHVQPSGAVLAHRIIFTKQNGAGTPTYITKGDSLDYFDFPIKRDNIIGKVIALERGGNVKNLQSFHNLVFSRIWAFVSPRTPKVRPLLTSVWRAGKFVKSLFTRNPVTGVFLRYLQGIPVYRRVIRLLSRGVKIIETNEGPVEPDAEVDNGVRETPGKVDALPVTRFQAKMGGRTIGSANLVRYPSRYFPFDGYYLTDMVVNPLCRGMGIGEKLVRHMKQRCRKEGANQLSLLVVENNHRAIKLYLKMGFKQITNGPFENHLEEEYRDTGIRRKLMFLRLNDRP